MRATLGFNRKIAMTVAFAVFAIVGVAEGQPVPKEGPLSFITCWATTSNILTVSKTHTASSFELIGNSRSEPAGGMYDKMALRCVGSSHTIDGKASTRAVCEFTDKDGDKIFTDVVGEAGKTTSRLLSATGKYEGMERTVAIESLGPFPAVRPGTTTSCNRNTGTYKLK